MTQMSELHAAFALRHTIVAARIDGARRVGAQLFGLRRVDDVMLRQTIRAAILIVGLTMSLPFPSAEAAESPHLGPASCEAYYEEEEPTAARAWCSAGSSFEFDGLEIFYVCLGDPTAPFIYLNHGWPTSSYDFAEIMVDLAEDYRVCALDTPGYGFSDKPTSGYRYSIFKDARIVEYFLTEVVRATELVLLTHDKGDSVGLEVLYRYLAENPGYRIQHHFILNGSIYLAEAEISGFQEALLDPVTGPPLADAITGPQLALLIGVGTFTPALTPREQLALATVFDYQDGTGVLDQTIKYLNERARFEEVRWLDALGRSDVPTTLIWGELDGVATTDVADYVWCAELVDRAAPARYWRVPAGNHYVQNDRPTEVAGIVRSELGLQPFHPAHGDERAAYLYADTGDGTICNP